MKRSTDWYLLNVFFSMREVRGEIPYFHPLRWGMGYHVLMGMSHVYIMRKWGLLNYYHLYLLKLLKGDDLTITWSSIMIDILWWLKQIMIDVILHSGLSSLNRPWSSILIDILWWLKHIMIDDRNLPRVSAHYLWTFFQYLVDIMRLDVSRPLLWALGGYYVTWYYVGQCSWYQEMMSL